MFVSILPYLSVLSFRFLGLFIILPVISILISNMDGADELTVGIAIGAPYLVQMFLQPLFGRASDIYSRKTVVIVGLIIFLIGSLICMSEDSIYTLIVGRCLQGAGAIGGVLSALIADCVREELRTRAMAIMGGGIFLSFIIAMILGSVLGFYYGLSSLFLLTSILTFLSILIIIFFVKNTKKMKYVYPTNSYVSARFDKSIKILYFGSFVQKMFMILTFTITPIILREYIGGEDFYLVYIPAIICGILALGPSSIISEKKGMGKEILLASIVLFFITYGLMYHFLYGLVFFTIALAVFFVAFSTQEALLQGMISKFAKAKHRGKIMGDFTAFGYAGSFVGAIVGGYFTVIDTLISYSLILFVSILAICVVWFILTIILLISPEKNAKTIYLSNVNITNINSIKGIMEWYENTTQGVFVVKYDTSIINENSLIASLKKEV